MIQWLHLYAPHQSLEPDRLSPLVAPARQDVFRLLDLRPAERVLLLGVGTGADLPLLPAGCAGWGIDLSPEMLAQAREKLQQLDLTIGLAQADAQRLPFAGNSFDVAVLSLVLSVVPNGSACWRETQRILRPGGRAVIFDKFLPEDRRPSIFRRLINTGTMLLGTDLNRHLSDILGEGPFIIERDIPSLLNGMYRILLIRFRSEAHEVAEIADIFTYGTD